MIDSLNKTIVNDTFNRAYNEEQFKLFIKDLLIDANFEKAHNIMLPNDYKDFIKSARRICKYKYTSEEYVDEKVIDVLVVKLKKTSSVERARVAQRNFVARYLNGSRDYQKDAALVAFISEDENENISPDWRFSFVQMNYKTEIVEGANGKKKRVTSVELTPAKRFSFLVGENEDTHTAQKQLATCLQKSSNGEKITIEDLVQAFDIEKVSKEFFDKYKALYLKLRDELIRLCNEDKIVNKDFVEHKINIDDFAKKTLGQLVFLYFIQKKGWLGVQKDKDWGTGDKKFLRRVFDKEYGEYNNFFNDILEHLFYEALALDRTDKNDLFELLDCRIPFLNGGLFEPVNGYEWTRTDLTINNGIFKEIFETFDLYNFTVKEDEPLEKEVAIDPEMLGKVFENLLPENERKGNGAFYTPREIVHYMCQESLINYLYNKVNIKEVPLTPQEEYEQQSLFKQKKIEQLKLKKEVIDEIIPKEDIEFLVKTGNSTYVNKTRGINVTLPNTIKNNASLIDKALSDIKVCDPAIGSGAFPVGMMNEIVRARATLSEFLKPDRPIYELKRNVIENSIYGVDIDPGAVDIAKLRFWLSLVVDEEDIKNIKPLPNLDYKIMQGNSLITSYEGIDFDEIIDEYKPNTQLTFNLWGDKTPDLKFELKQKQNAFLNSSQPSEKSKLKDEIENIIVDIVKEKLQIKAKEGKLNYQELEERVRNFAQNREKRNFFPWKLFFADVFDKGGFDVVIGNPPYISHDKMEDSLKKVLKEKFSVFSPFADIYCYFIEKANIILNTKGISTFITSNSYLKTDYGKPLRDKLIYNNTILSLINIEDSQIFESAIVNTAILVTQNNKQNINAKVFNKSISNSSNFSIEVDSNSYDYLQEFFVNKIWSLDTPEDLKLIRKIAQNKETLETLHTKIRLGIATGDNNVFIIDENKKMELIKQDIKNADIIKPILRGRDIMRYYYKLPQLYVILTKNGINVEKDYPTLYQYFDSFGEKFKKRGAKGQHWTNLRACAFFDDFKEDKIIWIELTDKGRFSLCTDEIYLVNSAYFLIPPKGIDIKYLLGILNSKVIQYYLSHNAETSGMGTTRWINNHVKEFPIVLEHKYINNIISIVNNIILFTTSIDYEQNTQKQQSVKEYENQIDIMVYKLYDLTYSEVQTIDPTFPSIMSEDKYNEFKI